MSMLGSSCSPCCKCLCADTCVYCATLDDGTSTYNSCTSLMFDGGPPTRTSACRGLLTQPVYSQFCGGTRILIGDMSGVNFSFGTPPSPFLPLQQLACFGQGVAVPGPGFYYAQVQSEGSPGVSSRETRFQASATAFCNSTLSQVSFNITYYYQVTRSEVSTVSGVSQQKVQGTTYSYNLSFSRAFSLFPSCSGATSRCSGGAGGDFALADFDASLSIEELSYSINDGLFTGNTTTGTQITPKKTEFCRISFLDSNEGTDCDDFLDIGDGLFEPLELSFSLFQDADQYPCNPLP
jgi:hypothetical protein